MDEHETRKRKCRHCGDLYRSDPRHLPDQRYCGESDCQKARTRKSWRRWFARPENRAHYQGSENVDRTRQWRAAHPGYWKRGPKRPDTLPNAKSAQAVGSVPDRAELTSVVLQNASWSQPALVA